MIYQILSDEQFLTLEIEVEESSGIKQLNPTSSDFYIISKGKQNLFCD
jgi:hypothetical protein